MTYTTIQGQHWDEAALAIYGRETAVEWLWANNPTLLDTYIFDAGTVLNAPELPAAASSDGTLPPWRTA